MGVYDNDDTYGSNTDVYETNWVGPDHVANPWGEGVEINLADNGDSPDIPVYRVAGQVVVTSGEVEAAYDDGGNNFTVDYYRQAIMSAARAKGTGRQWGRDL
jgi:hypothetical protein